MLNIALFGPPGAGKGTQSEQLITTHKLTHIAPGNIFREEIYQNTPLGKQVKKYIDKGYLVPNELVLTIVEKKMQANLPHTKGFLFDGYPRTQLQAEALDTQLAACNTSLNLVIFLMVEEEERQRRIKHRSTLLGRIDDQDETSIVTRMKLYQKDTLPIINYYHQQQKLVKVVSKGTVLEVATQIRNAINTHLAQPHNHPI